MLAKGSFTIQITPCDDGDHKAGRLLLDKKYEGDLIGTADGQMLSYRSQTPGYAGYVAIERVTASLGKKEGAFHLQHHAKLIAGEGEPFVSVVPGSGTGDFIGLKGDLKIIIEKGEHFYEFDYTLE